PPPERDPKKRCSAARCCAPPRFWRCRKKRSPIFSGSAPRLCRDWPRERGTLPPIPRKASSRCFFCACFEASTPWWAAATGKAANGSTPKTPTSGASRLSWWRTFQVLGLPPIFGRNAGGLFTPRHLISKRGRVAEPRHAASPLSLVRSHAEQALLEELIDRRKPALPKEPEFAKLDYLLFTPFRYPPLRHGSRFGRRDERGIWFGSEARRTVFAEKAYYRFLFL